MAASKLPELDRLRIKQRREETFAKDRYANEIFRAYNENEQK